MELIIASETDQRYNIDTVSIQSRSAAPSAPSTPTQKEMIVCGADRAGTAGVTASRPDVVAFGGSGGGAKGMGVRSKLAPHWPRLASLTTNLLIKINSDLLSIQLQSIIQLQ